VTGNAGIFLKQRLYGSKRWRFVRAVFAPPVGLPGRLVLSAPEALFVPVALVPLRFGAVPEFFVLISFSDNLAPSGIAFNV
jgi:hypothetical protein